MKKLDVNKMNQELEEGMKLKKCRQCGCMKETLEIIKTSIRTNSNGAHSNINSNSDMWLKSMEPIKYECLGCEYCYPAEALNIYQQIFPEVLNGKSLSCSFEIKENKWPAVPGEYFVINENSPIAVSTLSSINLAEKIAKNKPAGLSIVGKTETENIGIDKVIKNIITNKSITHFIVAGKDPKGHETGKTILYLKQNGVDENMRVIGSPGKRPILRNVTLNEIDTFRSQVKLIDMIECEDENLIINKISQLAKETEPVNNCSCSHSSDDNIILKENIPVIEAKQPKFVEMDKAGYFVIIAMNDKNKIIVEHYTYDNKLSNIIEGRDAKSIYLTIIQNEYVSQLTHAAYLGRELERAELSMKYGFKYVQDGAGGSYYEKNAILQT